MTATTIDIQLSAPANLRDLGGIPIAGGIIREGLALRADDLSVITDDDARRLVDGGLTAVIDLRTSDEAVITDRGPLTGYLVAYHHLPLMESIGAGMPDGDRLVLDHVTMGRSLVRVTLKGLSPAAPCDDEPRRCPAAHDRRIPCLAFCKAFGGAAYSHQMRT